MPPEHPAPAAPATAMPSAKITDGAPAAPAALDGARWRCVVIHGGQAERRAQMQARLDAAGLAHKTDFRPWVSADELRRDPRAARQLARGVRWHYHADFSWSELGCFLAHRNRWQELVADPAHDWYVILEDDAEPTPALAAVAENLIAARDGDLVRLHCTLRQPGAFQTVRELTPGHHLLLALGPPAATTPPETAPDRRRLPAPASPATAARAKLSTTAILESLQLGAVAYLVSKRGAARLLEANATISRPVDWELARFWALGVPPLVVWPPLSGDNRLETTHQRARADALIPRARLNPPVGLAVSLSRRLEVRRMRRALAALPSAPVVPDRTLAPGNSKTKT